MSELVVSQVTNDDLVAIGRLLVAEGICKAEGLTSKMARSVAASPETCVIARRDGVVVGAVLAVFKGFHVFLSHIVVSTAGQRRGIGKKLHDELVTRAAKLGAVGIITDSWLTATGLYYSLGYRLPGAVFLVRDVP
jgi:ribosomal protein S18 acetylase RimI-like enzyme